MTVLGRHDSRRDALMAAALRPPADAFEAWQRFLASGVDPLSDPVALRWLPLIGWNLRDTAIDESSRAVFQQTRHGMWAANMRLLDAVKPAIDALTDAGVRVMVLKGAALALTVYESAGLRPIGDVDILVPPGQAEEALDVLADRGWQPVRSVARRDLLLCHGLNLQKPPAGALDLHWYLLAESCWPGADEGLWRRARLLDDDRLRAFVLSPADQLLHVCLHGLRWSPVQSGHWVADAARVITHGDSTVDWNVLVEEARRRRLTLQMSETLRVVRDLGGASVPASVFASLDAEPSTWRDRLECRVKTRPVTSLGGMFLIWSNWSRVARGGGQAPAPMRYLAASVGVPSPGALLPWALGHARRRAVSSRRRS